MANVHETGTTETGDEGLSILWLIPFFLVFGVCFYWGCREHAAMLEKDRKAQAAQATWEKAERALEESCYASGGFLVAGWDHGLPRRICLRQPEVGGK